MQQIVRTLTMAEDGDDARAASLIRDRDRKWSGTCSVNLGRGIRVVHSARPNANVRRTLVRSIKKNASTG